MSLLRRGLFAAPALVLASSALAQLRIPVKWYAIQSDDKVFVVEMPGVPDHKVLDARSAAGTAFTFHSYSVDAGDLSFVAQTALYPADVDVSKPRLNLQAALADRAQRLEAGKWTKVDWREVQGAPAAESIGVASGGNDVRQLVLLKGRRYVSLGFLGPAASVRGAEAERFFKSLRLTQ